MRQAETEAIRDCFREEKNTKKSYYDRVSKLNLYLLWREFCNCDRIVPKKKEDRKYVEIADEKIEVPVSSSYPIVSFHVWVVGGPKQLNDDAM